jgi:glycosyltransferase involved in cell wall biosynthesis
MDIVCFANDWDGDPLSKKHIMRRLARAGSRVLWVSSLGNRAPRLRDAQDRARLVKKVVRFAGSALRGPRPVEENVWVVEPIAAPVYGLRGAAGAVAARVNGLLVGAHVRAAAARLRFRRPVHYSFVPQSAWVAGRLDEALVVYHAADEYAAFGGADPDGVRRLERALLSRADLYVACSAPLLGKPGPRESILVRHGVEHAHFARALAPDTRIPDALRELPRPVVGFFGLIAEWVDLGALAETADRLAASGGGSVVLVGDVRGAAPSAVAALRARANVLFAGRRPYEELPGWCRGFDAAVLPFVRSELTMAANPLKLREYLAAGLPVVSSAIPEAAALADGVNRRAPGAVTLAATSGGLARAAVERARAEDAGPRRDRSDAVEGESWDAKADELRAALERALARRVDRIVRRHG